MKLSRIILFVVLHDVIKKEMVNLLKERMENNFNPMY